jgi:hypothetical protein
MSASPSTAVRRFPFVAGTKFKATDWVKAERAVKVFKEIWNAVQAGRLTKEDVAHSFFYSTSDLISYRESWKCGQYWSVGAWETALTNGKTTELVAEHVLPRDAILQEVLSIEDWATAKQYLWDNSFVCIITKAENKRLGAAKLSKVGFPHDPWERYKRVKIYVLDAECPAGTYLMTAAERARLQAKGLLIGMASAGVEMRDPLPPTVRKPRKKKGQA